MSDVEEKGQAGQQVTAMTRREFSMANGIVMLMVFGSWAIVSASLVRAQHVAGELTRQWLASEQLAELPDNEGFAGMFAGTSNGVLLVAGGANFPTGRPWQGGQKVWYDEVFRLEQSDGSWIASGKLPRPLGYGVSVSIGDRVICVGGNNSDGHWADTFSLCWQDQQLHVEPMSPLPKPLANACGAIVGNWLYIAGGQHQPEGPATDEVWRMDLTRAQPVWEAVEKIPGASRMLAMAAAVDDSFWVLGGVELVASPNQKWERKYLADVWRLESTHGWQNPSQLPHPLAAAPTPAPVVGGGLFLLGGDDGAQVGNPPETHRGFKSNVLRLDLQSDRWQTVAAWEQPRVTTPCVVWLNKWVIPSGEIRPGIRTPVVSQFEFRRP